MTGGNGIMGISFDYAMQATSTSTNYKVNFMSIIEYTESGENMGYQASQDSLVQTWTMPKSNWNTWYGPYSGGSSSLAFNTSTMDGILSLDGYISNVPVFLTENSYQLHPSEVKFIMGIDFTESYKSRTGQSVLAIEANIITTSTITKDSTSITIAGDQPGIFKWPSSAKNANGKSVTVFASDLTQLETNEWKMYFTLNSTERTTFEWSPSVSVINNPPPEEEKSAAGTNMVTGVQVLILLVVMLCSL